MPSQKLLNAACSAGFCCCAAAAAAGPAFARDEVAVELGGRLVHEFAWSRDGVGPFDRHSFAPASARACPNARPSRARSNSRRTAWPGAAATGRSL